MYIRFLLSALIVIVIIPRVVLFIINSIRWHKADGVKIKLQYVFEYDPLSGEPYDIMLSITPQYREWQKAYFVCSDYLAKHGIMPAKRWWHMSPEERIDTAECLMIEGGDLMLSILYDKLHKSIQNQDKIHTAYQVEEELKEFETSLVVSKTRWAQIKQRSKQ